MLKWFFKKRKKLASFAIIKAAVRLSVKYMSYWRPENLSIISIWLFSLVMLCASYKWKSIASLSPGPSSLLRGARRIWRLDLALPHELHSTVVMPLMRTPSACCTRCSIDAGPGCPRRLCQITADDFGDARAVLELVCVWKVALGAELCSNTHWP
jgi:hypothetical protein